MSVQAAESTKLMTVDNICNRVYIIRGQQIHPDKLYDEIEEIETLIEEVETRLYNIRQTKGFVSTSAVVEI